MWAPSYQGYGIIPNTDDDAHTSIERIFMTQVRKTEIVVRSKNHIWKKYDTK